ncbi:MAG: hypothetical protein GXY86_08875 [Firmicutes bacterium]|nr:hypothetical protein [Bacillota bacterium]
MNKEIVFDEAVFTKADPKRTFRTADECLVAIRLIESKKEASTWIYEYEVSGEIGKIKKFIARLKKLEPTD